MLHPIGSLPPGVYWRRRLAAVALLVVVILLLAVTVHALTGRSKSTTPPAAAATTTPPTGPGTTPATTPVTSAAGTTSSIATHSATPTATSTAPKMCTKSQLKVAAATSAASYPVGSEPVMEIEVTNTGPTACVQDLADPQIELRIYNGAARVWGSHDCKITPGTDLETLPVNEAIVKTIQWSGLSSEPNCAGIRQRVGAGTYTLYAYLAGTQGTTVKFAIS